MEVESNIMEEQCYLDGNVMWRERLCGGQHYMEGNLMDPNTDLGFVD